MVPEKLFHELLGLGMSWEVTDCKHGDQVLELHVRETEHLWERERCPVCGGRVKCYDHVEAMEWRHLNCFNYRCDIICRLPRGRCQEKFCGHTYRVTPPWEGRSKHFTKEFEAFALVLAREMPIHKASEILKESDPRLWRMILAHVEAAYKEADFSEVTCVGVDEASRRKGHHYLSVFCDMLAKRVLYATEGKDQTTWHRFIEELGKHNGHPHAIQEISMDMSPAYIRGASDTCRNAKIVFDKFHVVAHVNDAVDLVRKNEIRRGDSHSRNQLKNTRWFWLKNPENLTEKQQECFQRIDQENLYTAKAYQMKLTLQDIYKIPHASLAKKKFLAWCRWVKRSAKRAQFQLLDAMKRAAQMIETHLDGILAYWQHHTTNAFLEGLNSVFSAIKRKARGYRSSRIFIAMLYFIAGKLRIPAT